MTSCAMECCITLANAPDYDALDNAVSCSIADDVVRLVNCFQ